VPHTHRLALTVTDSPAAVERILSTCRSRQCAIVSLHFTAGDRHRPGRVELTLDGPPRMVRLATGRLARLLDVIAVERLDATADEPVAIAGDAASPLLLRAEPVAVPA
jgi:acetolactate synthase regulatory subunit